MCFRNITTVLLKHNHRFVIHRYGGHVFMATAPIRNIELMWTCFKKRSVCFDIRWPCFVCMKHTDRVFIDTVSMDLCRVMPTLSETKPHHRSWWTCFWPNSWPPYPKHRYTTGRGGQVLAKFMATLSETRAHHWSRWA